MEHINIVKIGKTIIIITGGILSSILGGWDMFLKILVVFSSTDYLLGVIVSMLTKTTNSKVGFKGICKKVIMLTPVGLAYALDNLMNVDMLRNMTILFYIANEGISITENLGKAGIPIPKFLREVLVQLQEDNDEKEVM